MKTLITVSFGAFEYLLLLNFEWVDICVLLLLNGAERSFLPFVRGLGPKRAQRGGVEFGKHH